MEPPAHQQCAAGACTAGARPPARLAGRLLASRFLSQPQADAQNHQLVAASTRLPVAVHVPQPHGALVVAAGQPGAVKVHAPDGPLVAPHVLQALPALHIPQPAASSGTQACRAALLYTGGTEQRQLQVARHRPPRNRTGQQGGGVRQQLPKPPSLAPPSPLSPDAAVLEHVGAAAGCQHAACQLRAADVVPMPHQAAPAAAACPPVGFCLGTLAVGGPPRVAPGCGSGRACQSTGHLGRQASNAVVSIAQGRRVQLGLFEGVCKRAVTRPSMRIRPSHTPHRQRFGKELGGGAAQAAAAAATADDAMAPAKVSLQGGRQRQAQASAQQLAGVESGGGGGKLDVPTASSVLLS